MALSDVFELPVEIKENVSVCPAPLHSDLFATVTRGFENSKRHFGCFGYRGVPLGYKRTRPRCQRPNLEQSAVLNTWADAITSNASFQPAYTHKLMPSSWSKLKPSQSQENFTKPSGKS